MAIDKVDEALRGMRLRDLRALSEEELVQRHDLLMDHEHGVGFGLGPDDYLAELNRRATDRQTASLIWLTQIIAGLTVALFLLTAALVLLEVLPRVLGNH